MAKEKDFYQISLKLLLKNSLGEILALKAVDTGTFAGFYDLPGGRIDTDEFTISVPKIIQREVKEEIGDVTYKLNPKPIALGRKVILAQHADSKSKDIHVLYLFFEAEYVDGKIQISAEHAGYEWINLSNIELSKHFAPGLIDGVKMYLGLEC